MTESNMSVQEAGDLAAAHDEIVEVIKSTPNEALDWQPGGGEWSPRYIISHMAHSNDFYLAILEQARAAGFGTVHLDLEPAVERMQATDAQIASCATVEAVLGEFEHAYGRLLAVLKGVAPDDLDHRFVLDTGLPYEEPSLTTLRRRVIETSADHLREHLGQSTNTLAGYAEHRQRT